MPPPKIQVNEELINDIARKLLVLRNETSQVRNGSNPSDPAHPPGFALNKIEILAGGPNWSSGTALKDKLQAIGGQLDQRIVTMDQKLDHYVQVLRNLLRDSDDTEHQNIFLGQFMGQ